MPLHIDLETYSEADLPKTGAYYYGQHPSTRILLLAYSYGDEPKIIDLAHGEKIPPKLLSDLTDPAVIKWAHNANFERCLLMGVLGLDCPPEQWRCTAVWGRSLSLPAGLDSLGKVLKIGDAAKIEDGRRLIQKFSKPSKTRQADLDDSDWQAFKDYCLQDVRAEMAIAKRLAKYPMPEREWSAWHQDQRINDTGMPIDRTLVESIQAIANTHQEQTTATVQALTGIDNPNSRNQLIDWIVARGVDVGDLQAATVRDLLADELPNDVRELLEHRQQLSRSSLAKFAALDRATCADDRLRGAFQFAGAGRTGRWAGRIFQPQNLPRPSIDDDEIATARELVKTVDAETMTMAYTDVSGVLSSLIRSAIAAPEGKLLAVADYASIETIMIAWCAESEYLLDLYRQGLDPYIDFATKIYKIPYERVTKQQRSFAKPAVLGCGYGLGGPGLKAYAESFGMGMSLKDAQRQVKVFRAAYADIPILWDQLDQAMRLAMKDRGKPVTAGRFTLRANKQFLMIQLPSGRSLYYYQPRIEDDGNRSQLTYMGTEPGTRVGTHPGKIVENLVQAVSRDLLVEGLRQVEAAGFQIIGHVHDEILCEIDADDTDALDRLIAAMTRTPNWCQDAPVRAAGYVASYYKKD